MSSETAQKNVASQGSVETRSGTMSDEVVYRAPTLIHMGNLRDLVGKSGTKSDMPGPHPKRT